VAHEVADDDCGGHLPDLDDELFPGCVPHPFAGSEMKLRAAILAVTLGLAALPAFSQGCAMCYSTAKGTAQDGQRALSRGVVVLLFPPLCFMTLGVWAAFRYGKRRDLEQARSFGLIDARQE